MRDRLASIVLILTALIAGATGAQGCRLYNQHVDQHRQAEQDHQLLQQIVPILNQLVQQK